MSAALKHTDDEIKKVRTLVKKTVAAIDVKPDIDTSEIVEEVLSQVLKRLDGLEVVIQRSDRVILDL